VAQAFINKAMVGFQTMLLLQTTQTTFHSKSIFSSLSTSKIPAGVQGTNALWSQTKTFH
jgi:hypothetical protein